MPKSVTPKWPPDGANDEYFAVLPRSDWAWEFLRRDPAYGRAASASQAPLLKVVGTATGIPVYKPQKHEEAARDWALCSFR